MQNNYAWRLCFKLTTGLAQRFKEKFQTQISHHIEVTFANYPWRLAHQLKQQLLL